MPQVILYLPPILIIIIMIMVITSNDTSPEPKLTENVIDNSHKIKANPNMKQYQCNNDIYYVTSLTTGKMVNVPKNSIWETDNITSTQITLTHIDGVYSQDVTTLYIPLHDLNSNFTRL